MQAFKEELTAQNITVSGTPQVTLQAPDYDGMKLLYTYQSPALKDIIFIVNKRSFNLYS